MSEFVRLRFTGGRFSDGSHAMPVELLGDLAAYQELLLNVARAVYLQEHPNRKRVPRRFGEGLSLRLRWIKPGSAMPVLERPVTETLDLGDDVFMKSHGLLEDAFSGSDDPELLELFHRVPSGPLKAFARDLADDETVELLRPGINPGKGVSYGHRQRRELLKRLMSATDEPYEGVLRVIGLATESQRVSFKDAAGSSFSGSYEQDQFKSLREGLNSEGNGDRYLIQGVAQVDSEGSVKQLRTMSSVENVEGDLSRYADLRLQLDDLGQLEDGWSDGDGVRVVDGIVVAALELLDAICDDRQPPPTLVSATLDGAVRLEWHIAPRVTSIDCETDGSIELVSTLKGSPSQILTFNSVLECVEQLNEIGGVFDAG